MGWSTYELFLVPRYHLGLNWAINGIMTFILSHYNICPWAIMTFVLPEPLWHFLWAIIMIMTFVPPQPLWHLFFLSHYDMCPSSAIMTFVLPEPLWHVSFLSHYDICCEPFVMSHDNCPSWAINYICQEPLFLFVESHYDICHEPLWHLCQYGSC